MEAASDEAPVPVPGMNRRCVDDPSVLFPGMLLAAKIELNLWLAAFSFVVRASLTLAVVVWLAGLGEVSTAELRLRFHACASSVSKPTTQIHVEQHIRHPRGQYCESNFCLRKTS